MKNEKIEEILKYFDEKINELRQLMPDCLEDVETDFGFRTIRGDEIFTIYDIGNIKKFIEKSVIDARKQLLDEIREEIKKEIVVSREMPNQDEYESGFRKALFILECIIKSKYNK